MSQVTKVLLIALIAATAISVMFVMNKSSNGDEETSMLRTDSKLKERFAAYKAKFRLRFHSIEEDLYRLTVFAKNLAHIKKENANANHTYLLAENEFTHITRDEFVQYYFGLQEEEEDEENGHEPDGTPILSTQGLPESINWVELGAVTPVKNQGKCGACYAFSATGGLEGAYFLKTGELLSFSEQQIMDCSVPEENQGCDGGFPNNAFFFAQNHGIATEDQYPLSYQAQSDFVCLQQESGHKVSKFYNVKKGSCGQLQAAIAQQPISVGVDAGNFHFYSSGILNDCGTALNHGVTAVGYTSEYWLLKNSWGPKFGENGFIRIARGNTCGVCLAASYPVF